MFQTCASADIGSIACETARGGVLNPGMLVNQDVIVEIVRTGSGKIVVSLFHHDYPLLRFAAGDMSAPLVDAPAPRCGRTNARIKGGAGRGWPGRADQTTKLRARLVHPAPVANILRRHPAITKARLVVVTVRIADDRMTLRCEVVQPLGPAGLETIVASIRDVTRRRAEMQLEAPGALPGDGKLIEAARNYS